MFSEALWGIKSGVEMIYFHNHFFPQMSCALSIPVWVLLVLHLSLLLYIFIATHVLNQDQKQTRIKKKL